jgi:hypothetical protein
METPMYVGLNQLDWPQQAMDEEPDQLLSLYRATDALKRLFYLSIVYWFSSIFIPALLYCFLSFTLGLVNLGFGQFIWWVFMLLLCSQSARALYHAFQMDIED